MPVTFEATGDWDGFDREIQANANMPNLKLGTGVPDTKHPGDRASRSGLSYADIADINEFGNDEANVPARPIFGPAMRKNENLYAEAVIKAYRRATRKSGSAAAFRRELQSIARRMVADVHSEWTLQDFEALADSTIARKGHDIAWLEGGDLLQAVQSFVEIQGAFNPGAKRFKDSLGRFMKGPG